MNGFIHLIVPIKDFRLVSGEDDISTYEFNTGVARHFFCRRCGVKSFYIPRSNPDGYSINVRCIDPGTIKSMRVDTFDGRNWEDHAHSLRHLTE